MQVLHPGPEDREHLNVDLNVLECDKSGVQEKDASSNVASPTTWSAVIVGAARGGGASIFTKNSVQRRSMSVWAGAAWRARVAATHPAWHSSSSVRDAARTRSTSGGRWTSTSTPNVARTPSWAWAMELIKPTETVTRLTTIRRESHRLEEPV
ncbi:hypothetical protein TRIUR3_27605 [Triticum urartu]|uniref:Uncharacterized protein n=1 Tax=Triticum urartu TaxID=4572 RepID=M7XM70_TRIUA|nr:hypothetical protein TRIUR3_27605 [Triticum urartu]